MKIFVTLALSLLFLVSCSSKSTIKGGIVLSDNQQLGGTSVWLIPADQARARMAEVRDLNEGETGLPAYSDLFFDTTDGFVPTRFATIQADGQFHLSIDAPGDYVIAARATNQVGSQINYYFWLQPVKAGGGETNLVLTPQNSAGKSALDF